ncbi:MAG: hypothetical protein ACOH2V_03460 [Candidatus Saccharimonadaceae bacterium]
MSKLKGNQADKMANGLTLLIFGFLLLLIQLRVTNHWFWMTYIRTPATYFLIAGVVSLWLKRDKSLGYILTGIGVMGYADIYFNYTSQLTQFAQHAFPMTVMLVGGALVYFAKR